MDNTIFKQVGNNIKNILLAQGKTQQYLADKLGISKQVMSKIIAGSKAINVLEITKIADALNVSVDKLVKTKAVQEPKHHLSIMEQVANEDTKAKIEYLETVIDDLLMLEEHADGR